MQVFQPGGWPVNRLLLLCTAIACTFLPSSLAASAGTIAKESKTCLISISRNPAAAESSKTNSSPEDGNQATEEGEQNEESNEDAGTDWEDDEKRAAEDRKNEQSTRTNTESGTRDTENTTNKQSEGQDKSEEKDADTKKEQAGKDSENGEEKDTTEEEESSAEQKKDDKVPEKTLTYWEETMEFGTPSQKKRVLKRMRYTKHKRIIPILVKALEDEKHKEIREKIVQIFYEKQASEAFPVLIKQLNTAEEADIIATAAAALGQLKDQRAVPHLAKLLTNREHQVQQAAVQALGEIGELDDDKKHSCGPRLLKMLDDSLTNKDIKYDIILTLGKIRYMPAYDSLRRIAINRVKPKHMRGLAVFSLGELANPDILPDLFDMLQKEKYPRLKYRIINALGKMQSPQSLQYLIKAMSDGDEKVRIAAVKAVAQMKKEELVKPLIYRLKYDTSAKVMIEAAKALHQLKRGDTGELILEKFRASSDAAVLKALLPILRELQPEGLGKALRKKKKAMKYSSVKEPIEEAIAELDEGSTTAEDASDEQKADGDTQDSKQDGKNEEEDSQEKKKSKKEPKRIYLE